MTLLISFCNFKETKSNAPGGTVDKNLPANAGKMGFHPWFSKIPHPVEQLSPCSIAPPEPTESNKRNHHNEKPTYHEEEQSLVHATRKST